MSIKNFRHGMNKDLEQLPYNLPQSRDDEKFDYLVGITIPSITLISTEGVTDVSKIDVRYIVLYFFPMMSIPEKALLLGWNDIPGARGCTSQNITINEHIEDLQEYGVGVCGISTQSVNELTEISLLRKLSQQLISDSSLKFQEKLQIQTFRVENKTMYKRLTLIVKKFQNC